MSFFGPKAQAVAAVLGSFLGLELGFFRNFFEFFLCFFWGRSFGSLGEGDERFFFEEHES